MSSLQDINPIRLLNDDFYSVGYTLKAIHIYTYFKLNETTGRKQPSEAIPK